jgi:hypothetical protein
MLMNDGAAAYLHPVPCAAHLHICTLHLAVAGASGLGGPSSHPGSVANFQQQQAGLSAAAGGQQGPLTTQGAHS